MVPYAQGPVPETDTQGVLLHRASPTGSKQEGWARETDVTPTPSSLERERE